MSDPLSDPRAHDLLSADPGEVWNLASLFTRVASEAGEIAGALRGASHDATWEGAAAMAFRRTIGKLPGDLDKVRASYQDVATALNAYEGELASAKSDFQRVADQLGGARSSFSAAQGQLSSAQSSLSSAQAAPHAKPNSPAVTSAHNAVSAASGAVSRLQGEVTGLESQGFAILDRFQHARDGCQGRVSHACSLAPHQSWLDAALSDVGNFMSGAGHFLFSVAKGVWNGVTGLPGALVNFVEHPSWESFGKLAEDVAITAGVVLLVTGVGEAFLPEEAAMASAVAGTGDAAEAVATGAGYAGAGAQGAQAAGDAFHGDFAAAGAHLADGALAVAALNAPELGDALPASRAADAAAEDVTALGTYSNGVAAGLTPVQALAGMSSQDRSVVLESAGLESGSMLSMSSEERLAFLSNLRDPTATTEQAAANARALEFASLPGKRAVNFAQDNLINDPLKQYAQDKVNHAAGVKEGG